ncbi:MAG: sigma-70 family RNA polymerase sigma factor [Pseudomonadota bacterium]
MLRQEDLEALFVKRERSLFNIALRWTFNEAQADELVQEAFLRVWQQRRRVVPETANAYLYQTLNRLAMKLARRRTVWRRVKTLLGSGDASQDWLLPADQYDRIEVQEAIQALPDGQRAVLLMAEFSGLSQKEIGQALNLPTGTVGSRRHAALAKLKELLDG